MKKILVALVALGFAVCGSYAEDRVVLSEELAPIRESVTSVERRIERLEYPETCRLFWSSSYITNHWDEETQTIEIPTNFPTRNLFILASDDDITNLVVHLDATWKPAREVTVSIVVKRTTTTGARNTDVKVGNGLVLPTFTSGAQYRLATAIFDPLLGIHGWFSQSYTMPNPDYVFSTTSGARSSVPASWPATVDEWLELYQATP